jgi:ribosome biogenesis GTPase
MLEASGGCRFHNCQHLDEPDCAVIDAVANGKINSSRYQNYLKMLSQVKSG